MSSSCRRKFLHKGLAGFAAGALSQLGTHAGSGSWIDAHVHVWTNDFRSYPLAEGYKPEGMKPRTFLPEDILRHAKPLGVNRVVLIQMSYYRFDNSYMLDVIRKSPDVFRGVAIVDSNAAQPDQKMRELAKAGVRGFRISPGKVGVENWLDGEEFAKMFRCGAKDRLAMCPLIGPNALPALDRQCRKFPETPVVIDHMARLGADGPIREKDIRALCSMAQHTQVKVKVSAFYALGEKKPPHLDLAPLIHRLYDAFGPRRLMWASDCPFQVESETYADSVSLIASRLKFLSAEDKEWILRRTAEETFFA
jgi:predicted TIM-barrel fold metal-dependent hydrolase